jgi:hypothetical protein
MDEFPLFRISAPVGEQEAKALSQDTLSSEERKSIGLTHHIYTVGYKLMRRKSKAWRRKLGRRPKGQDVDEALLIL